jgi:hypothetical protein
MGFWAIALWVIIAAVAFRYGRHRIVVALAARALHLWPKACVIPTERMIHEDPYEHGEK